MEKKNCCDFSEISLVSPAASGSVDDKMSFNLSSQSEEEPPPIVKKKPPKRHLTKKLSIRHKSHDLDEGTL